MISILLVENPSNHLPASHLHFNDNTHWLTNRQPKKKEEKSPPSQEHYAIMSMRDTIGLPRRTSDEPGISSILCMLTTHPSPGTAGKAIKTGFYIFQMAFANALF
jgi:hypothetical protein